MNKLIQAIQAKQVIIYADENGHEPYCSWIDNLKDKKGQQRIRARIRRLGEGLYGDCESVGEGVSELRMFFGPGYRVYFGEDADIGSSGKCILGIQKCMLKKVN